MYSGSEDGTVKLWDMRAPGFQREYASRGAVNTVVLHPNQGELVSGAHLRLCAASRHVNAVTCPTLMDILGTRRAAPGSARNHTLGYGVGTHFRRLYLAQA